MNSNNEHVKCYNCANPVYTEGLGQEIRVNRKSMYYCSLCTDVYQEHLNDLEQEPQEIPEGSEKVRVKETPVRYNDRTYRTGVVIIILSKHFNEDLFERV